MKKGQSNGYYRLAERVKYSQKEKVGSETTDRRGKRSCSEQRISG